MNVKDSVLEIGRSKSINGGHAVGPACRVPRVSVGKGGMADVSGESTAQPVNNCARRCWDNRPQWDIAFGAHLGKNHGVKVRDVVRRLQNDGWYRIRIRGSHHQFRHRLKRGLVTVPGRPSDDLAPGTLNSILKQAGLK